MNREGKRRSRYVLSQYKFLLTLREEDIRTFVFLKATQALCHLCTGTGCIQYGLYTRKITVKSFGFLISQHLLCGLTSSPTDGGQSDHVRSGAHKEKASRSLNSFQRQSTLAQYDCALTFFSLSLAHTRSEAIAFCRQPLVSKFEYWKQLYTRISFSPLLPQKDIKVSAERKTHHVAAYLE